MANSESNRAEEPVVEPAAAGSAFAGAQYLMGLQLFTKLATFAMNVVIVKLAGIASYGVASVDFELLLSTLLFISREGMRNALLRVESDPPAHRNSRQKPGVKDQLLINASLVPIGLGMVMANLVFLVFKSTSDSDWKTAIVIYIVAGWVELCVEPLYVLSRAQVLFQVQAKCEGIAVTARCITVTTLLITGRHIADADDNNPYSLLAFAAGQMVYALTILATYAWYMSHELEYPVWHCYVPRQIASSGHFVMPETRKLAVTFVGQSLLKHCLTQGDNMLMVKYASNAIKGTFAMVSNYGSIPARIIFLPLEEASRAMFSRQSTATSAQQTENARLVRRVIEILAKFQLLLGSILVVFGTLYSSTFMALLGQDDPTASNTMSMYCLYLPLMGLNGFLEAFVHSVADRNQLLHVNIWMIICTITYVVISVQILSVLQLGSAGIVAANMVNMAMRIVYCTRFVKTWFVTKHVDIPRISEIAPHRNIVLACVGSAVLVITVQMWVGEASVFQMLMVLGFGGILGLAVLAIIWRYERRFIGAVRDLKSGNEAKLKTD